ncbi:MAG: chromosomal replication initiator protein DnaA [Epsilonproteobacteria bacterium]|nr:chromosomal replication initiator protein DnaA [Campylobacterota bacterium]OIO17981.1 MAG: chromosomal replication initiation protein DnaA [Helicobacteraceae bacterium CG1_02_36_14]PIP09990.1 MAG: chromosomal replication initiator protein DnaA [Sulfurimonas sp. CG23_combo_of_CG06-09_8_20_14_all_36_33]PIS25229.1 MAG: chromosomal replication initiator protein DnaA [Sulfurimonas sp. CG08_land_8_20_14_0_20_36_33]PIU35363.1 MAG: chromosomal replication initiator protein DnaA [Sulfurimonas sp. CG0
MEIGQEVLLLLKEEITESEYNRYIKQLSYDSKKSTSDLAVFYAPNALVCNWIKSKYTQKIAHLFEVKNNSKVTVSISLKNQLDKRKIKKATEQKTGHSLLNPSHIFDNFMVGGSNQFAYAAVKSVSEKAGQLYNPLFIYGGVGLGKTHLMQAAGNVFQNQGKTVIYTTVEQFLNDFIRHVRNKTMERFQEKYRKCDVLLIDDIQFLSNKEGIQEEFFHTFEALKGAGKQIILTADKHPKKIGGLEKRLQSRFEHGLVADIQPPELETKIAIIENKCEINKVKLTKDIINYIATVIESNVREIEGILSKLHAYSQLMHVDIDLAFTKNVLKDQVQENRANLTMDIITNSVSKDLNIKPSEIRSKGRSKNLVYARRIAIYICRELTQSTMPQLAQYFGMKDHTAISHTLKKINELIVNDEDFKVKIDELTNKITSV